MAQMIRDRLPLLCGGCSSKLPTRADVQIAPAARLLNAIGCLAIVAVPFAVYGLFALAQEAHHGISIKMIIASIGIGCLPALGFWKLASFIRATAIQTCGHCGRQVRTAVRVVDTDD